MADVRLTVDRAEAALQGVPTEFVELFCHGTLTIEYYRPVGVDRQKQHTRDEVYMVVSGRGEFVCGEGRQPFEPGEVLFAPAGLRIGSRTSRRISRRG